MKASPEELKTMKAIAVHAGQTEEVVRSVCRGIWLSSIMTQYGMDKEGMEVHDDENEANMDDDINIIIPYICNLQLSYSEILKHGKGRVKVKMKATPSTKFEDEFEKIINEDTTETEKNLKKGIFMAVRKLMDSTGFYEEEEDDF